jgi:hypothetical protein
MTLRQLKEALDVGNKGALAIAFPRQPSVQPELALKADRDHSSDIRHHVLFPSSETKCLCRMKKPKARRSRRA